MKLTKSKLKQIIREEIQKLNEDDVNKRHRPYIDYDGGAKPSDVKKMEKIVGHPAGDWDGVWAWLSYSKKDVMLGYEGHSAKWEIWIADKEVWSSDSVPSKSILNKYGILK